MIAPIDLGIPGLTNIERIGAGGNAIVYRARQADLDRDVVVKVLTSVDAETTRRRFDRERRAMGRLSQAQGIAPLYGTGFTPTGQPYLLMPFYEQGTLQDRLDRDGALPPGRVRDIGVSVTRAIQTAHDKGVLHRDLKPANILIRNSGQPDVADFGIAHLTDDALGTSQALTMTPLYTAPEVFDGVESGAASDIYSVGAMLFALLNGYPAYSDPGGGTPVLTLIRRINEQQVPALPPSVPTDLVRIVEKAMAKDPADRYQSAGEFAEALAAADMTPPRKPSKKVSPAVLVAIVALLVASVGGAAAAFVLLDDSDTDDDPDPTPAPSAVATAEPDTTNTPTPASPTSTAEATTGPTPSVASFDLVAASQAADQALVRIEAFSCTGAEVATGVVLNDGIIVTEERVLESPWWVDVSADGRTLRATPQVSSAADGLAFVTVADASSFDVLPGTTVSVGEPVALVGIDGRPALAGVVEADADAGTLVAEVVNAGSGNAVEPLDIAVTDTGGLVGVARVGPGRIEIVPANGFQDDANRVEPSYGCPTLGRDLRPGDAESAVSPAISDLLTMQQLSNAYANEQWDLVRSLEPGKAALSDQDFVAGWRPLRQGFIYPFARAVDNGVARWRIGLIGHETWNGTDLTTLFCVTWTVDQVSGEVVQTNEDNVVVYGPNPDQQQQPGFVDPADLRDLIEANCAL